MICKMALHAPIPVNFCYSLPPESPGSAETFGNCCLDGRYFCRVPSQEQVLLAYGILTGLGALRSVGGRASEDRPGSSCTLPGSTDSVLLNTAAWDRGLPLLALYSRLKNVEYIPHIRKCL